MLPALHTFLTNHSQHFQKLRNECKQKFGEPGTAPKGTPTKGSPRKKAAPSAAGKTKGKTNVAANKSKASSSGKRKERDEVTDDEVESPATKKVLKEEFEQLS